MSDTDTEELQSFVKKPAFEVLVAREGNYQTDDPERFDKIQLLWLAFNWSDDYFSFRALNPVGNGPITGAETLGLSFIEPNTSNLNYTIGIENGCQKIPPNSKKITIPEATWAVFGSDGFSFQAIYNFIDKEWFPSTDYQQANIPQLTLILPLDHGLDYEVWVPLTDELDEVPLARKQEVWGKSEAFPSGDWVERKSRVGNFSGGYEKKIPDRMQVIQASSPISPLKTQYRDDLTYTWGPDMRKVADYLSSWPITGLIIARNGEIWVEEYQFDRKPDMRMTSWSMAKSVTSLLLGICLDKGLVKSMDDPADAYLGCLKGMLHGSVTLRHLSNMSSGAAIHNDRDTVAMYSPGFTEPDADLESVVKGWNETQEPPGFRFNYNELCALTIGMVIREVTGMSLGEFCQNELWHPMGAEADAVWLADSKGKEFNCAFFSARLRDWARLGQLVAQNGKINGRQVISKEWIDQCSSWSEKDRQVLYGKPRPKLGYKTFFWHSKEDGSWMTMSGAQGQVMLIDRNTQTVLIQTAVSELGVWFRELFELFNAATQLGTAV